MDYLVWQEVGDLKVPKGISDILGSMAYEALKENQVPQVDEEARVLPDHRVLE